MGFFFSSSTTPYQSLNPVPKNGLQRILGVYLGLGTILMLTYVWGTMSLINSYPTPNPAHDNQHGAAYLWGAIWDNKPLLHIYYLGFVLATTGYFLNLNWIVKVADKMDEELYKKICYSYAVFMISESFWMPFCVDYIASPESSMLGLIQFQLAVGALSGLYWAKTCWEVPMMDEATSQERLLGQIGCTLFALHCTCLDCCTWPQYFANDGRLPPMQLGGIDITAM